MASKNTRFEVTTAAQKDIRLRIVPGLVMAFDWRTGDLALAMPKWELAETMTAQRYRGLKVSQVPKSDRNIPLPQRVAERLIQILLDSMPG